MAKNCQVARQLKRRETVEKYRAKREELKKLIANPATDPGEKLAAVRKLDEMPRDGSRTRVVSRCAVTGRSRAVLKDFGLSRIKFREMAQDGYLPGVRMASW